MSVPPQSKAHATFTLNARKIRDFLVAHPGSTNDQVREATGHSVTRLQRMGLAYWKREEGEVKWYAKEGVSRSSKKPEKWEWRWNPDALHWEHGDEVSETKWEQYTP